jgi:hypothetical protein
MSNLDLVSITPSLGIEIKQNEITKKIIERLTELGLNDQKYKNSTDVILLVANLIEHLVQRERGFTKDKKINKKELLLNIFVKVFNIQANDRLIIENQVEFLHSNKAIKKLSKFYLFCCSAYEYLFKRREKKP